jgi:hypothetical protein
MHIFCIIEFSFFSRFDSPGPRKITAIFAAPVFVAFGTIGRAEAIEIFMFASLNPKPLMLRDARANGRVSAMTMDTSESKSRKFSFEDLPNNKIVQECSMLLLKEVVYVRGTLAKDQPIGLSIMISPVPRAILSASFISAQGACVLPALQVTYISSTQ